MTYDYEKDPDATLDFPLSWSRYLSGEDTISLSSWDVPDGLTVVTDTIDSPLTTIWLSGGTADTFYTLTNTVTTAAGRIPPPRDVVVWVHDMGASTGLVNVSQRPPEPLITPTLVRQRLKFEQGTSDSAIAEYIKAAHSKIVTKLGFDYPRTMQERTLDSTADPVLVLPGAGAQRIVSVFEDGEALSTSEYELDPDDGRLLRRLDTDGHSMNWVRGDRMVTVRYLPARPPEALIEAELVETINSYRGAQSGYADKVGQDGQTRRYRHALTSDTLSLIEDIKGGKSWGVW